MSKAIGFIGLGVMGFPMAGHLSKNHNVFVFNRSSHKSKDWVNIAEKLIVQQKKPF